VDAGKIRELAGANDNPNIAFTGDPEEIRNADFVIIAVPGPHHKIERPGHIIHRISSQNHSSTYLKRGAIVVLESTATPA